MTENARDELVQELEQLLVSVMDTAEEALDRAEQRREAEIKTVTLNLLRERHAEQQEQSRRMTMLNSRMSDLQTKLSELPRQHRDALSDQVSELASLVRLSLDGGRDRPQAREELDRWIELRWGHADDKKVKTDRNRILDFLDFAGDRPVNRYRYSDFQSFVNLLARVPANYSKLPRFRDMSRQQAADYNDTLPPDKRHSTLAGTAIESNYLSPLRMFFAAMSTEHEFRNPTRGHEGAYPTDSQGIGRTPTLHG